MYRYLYYQYSTGSVAAYEVNLSYLQGIYTAQLYLNAVREYLRDTKSYLNILYIMYKRYLDVKH